VPLGSANPRALAASRAEPRLPLLLGTACPGVWPFLWTHGNSHRGRPCSLLNANGVAASCPELVRPRAGQPWVRCGGAARGGETLHAARLVSYARRRAYASHRLIRDGAFHREVDAASSNAPAAHPVAAAEIQ
jgi:hypothetical protein